MRTIIQEMDPLMRRIIVAFFVIMVLALVIKKEIWPQYTVLRDNPQTVFVKVNSHSISPIFQLDNGETLYLPFDGVAVSQPRPQVYVGSHSSYWIKVFKNGQLKDDIHSQWRFHIATGDYRLEVRDRDTDQLISTVYIKAYFIRDEPDLYDQPVELDSTGFFYFI